MQKEVKEWSSGFYGAHWKQEKRCVKGVYICMVENGVNTNYIFPDLQE